MPYDRAAHRRTLPGFEKRLRALRLERSLSQVTVARRADMPEKTVFVLEKGGIDPQERTLIKLAQVLGTSVEYLARGEGQP